jgi:ketosteroid isomerase-like protein
MGRTEEGEDDKAHARIAGIEGNDGHLHFECIRLNRATNQIVPHSHVGVQADVIQVNGHWLIKDAKAYLSPNSQGGFTMAKTRSLAVAAAFLLVSGSAGYAQQNDMQQVQSVLTELHTAIAHLDVPKIMTLFAHDNYVLSKTPPDKSVAVGPAAVEKDWQANFDRVAELHLAQAEPYIHVQDNVAWQLIIVDTTGKLKTGEPINTLVSETVVLEKRDGKWLIVALSATRQPK